MYFLNSNNKNLPSESKGLKPILVSIFIGFWLVKIPTPLCPFLSPQLE